MRGWKLKLVWIDSYALIKKNYAQLKNKQTINQKINNPTKFIKTKIIPN